MGIHILSTERQDSAVTLYNVLYEGLGYHTRDKITLCAEITEMRRLEPHQRKVLRKIWFDGGVFYPNEEPLPLAVVELADLDMLWVVDGISQDGIEGYRYEISYKGLNAIKPVIVADSLKGEFATNVRVWNRK